MTTIVTRAGKGSPLTNNEVDTNFTNLNDAKIETLTSTDASVTITGTGGSRNLSVPVNPNVVSGPASATDNAVARFDTTTGKLIQNSLVTIDDNGNTANVNSITFDTTPATLPTTESSMYWDTDKGALAYIMQGGDVVQEIGESQYMYIQASANITKGQVVMFTGAVGGSGTPTGAPATGVTDGTYIMGIAAEDITSGTSGFVQTFGILKPVNTTGLATGTILWFDPSVAGGFTATKPTAPNVVVQVAAVTAGNSAGGALFVRITAGSKLGETDSNVLFSTLSGGNLIAYDATNQYWKNINLTDGTAISITETTGGAITIANTGVTQATAGTGISVSAGTGNVTITNTAPDQTVALTAGTGISTSGTYPNFTITNSAPDQTVALTGAGTTTITGTYPNFTITSNDQYTGTVTSVTGTSPVASSGGTTPAISLASGYGDTQNPYASKTANNFLAAPNGTNGVPTFRAIVAADIPTLNQNTTGSAVTFTSTTQNSQFNSIGVGTAASGTTGEIRATNNITAYFSDNRLKTKLGNIPNALEKLKTLNGFYYQPNETAQALGYEVKKEIGVSAQEVQAILPEVVAPAPIDDKYLTVRYERLVPLLIEAIKELSAEVEELREKVGK